MPTTATTRPFLLVQRERLPLGTAFKHHVIVGQDGERIGPIFVTDHPELSAGESLPWAEPVEDAQRWIAAFELAYQQGRAAERAEAQNKA